MSMAMMQINCSVDTPVAARAAIEGGANWITLTPPPLPRQYAASGLEAWLKSMQVTLALAREKGVRSSIALALRLSGADMARHEVYARALAMAGVDALVLADLGLMRFMHRHFPEVSLHAAPQASIANVAAMDLLGRHFGVTRACLPGTTALDAVIRMARAAPMEIEVLAQGSSGGMIEGLCSLSAFFSGTSATRTAACSPAAVVSMDRTRRLRSTSLKAILVDVSPLDNRPAHPSICNGRYRYDNRSSYPFGTGDRWAVLEALGRLVEGGVRFIRIAPSGVDGRTTRRIVATWRAAIQRCESDPAGYRVRPEWRAALNDSRCSLPCTVSVTAHAGATPR